MPGLWSIGKATMVVGIAVTLTGLGRASAATPTGPLHVIPSCANLAGSTVAYRANHLVVYRAAVHGDGGPHDWACAKTATGITPASALGTAPGGEFPTGVVVSDFESRGPWLVNLASSKRGWSSCPAPAKTPSCHREHHEIELTDTTDGGQTTAASSTHLETHLSVLPVHNHVRVAAVAWTQPAAGSLTTLAFITARDSTTRSGSGGFGLNTSITGKIAPASVQMQGLTVSYIENGKHRTVKLGV